jgi:IMP dehydrogenase
MKIRKQALTFDDVLLVPRYSEILPHKVNLSTRITKNITLNIPLVSAAMDTVTEYKTAITMARLGGIGIIHKNMSIEEQVLQIRKVKKSESGIIIDPISIKSHQTLNEAEDIMSEYKISGVPVIDDENNLIGILIILGR